MSNISLQQVWKSQPAIFDSKYRFSDTWESRLCTHVLSRTSTQHLHSAYHKLMQVAETYSNVAYNSGSKTKTWMRYFKVFFYYFYLHFYLRLVKDIVVIFLLCWKTGLKLLGKSWFIWLNFNDGLKYGSGKYLI